MDSKKVERLEKHKKEIKRKAYLNLVLTLFVGVGIGLVLWGPVAGILGLLIGEAATIVTILVIIGFGSMVYMTPLLHYREENELKSNKDPEYYLEKGWDKVPLIELIESQGWEEAKNTKEKIVLETYPSILHKAVGNKSTMEIEVLEREGNQETVIFKSNGKEIEKLKSIVKPEGEGSIIKEKGVSLKRCSPAYLELLLFILPQMQDVLKDAADEELKLIDENIEYGLSKFKTKFE